jgi:gamma-glutamylcyclotransferase (GGCT)/AIG2-like uncharacterized protein YtfP
LQVTESITTPGELLFVYGRLRRGGAQAFRMEGAEFIAKGSVPGMLYRLPGGPGLVRGELTSPRVTGELYRVTPGHLQRLEALDGGDPESKAKGESRRTRVLVHSLAIAGESWEAWAWEWTGPIDPVQRIRSGDWLIEKRPCLSDRLRLFPWFTLIGLICLVSFPLWMLAAPITGYYKSPFARLIRDAMAVGGLCSPFAAAFSLWLARRRGERDGLFGCLYSLSFAACSLVIVNLLLWLIKVIRG